MDSNDICLEMEQLYRWTLENLVKFYLKSIPGKHNFCRKVL